LNDTCDDFWEYQEQASNGLLETNTNEDTNIKEKTLRLVNHHFYDGVNVNTENVSNEVRSKEI